MHHPNLTEEPKSLETHCIKSADSIKIESDTLYSKKWKKLLKSNNKPLYLENYTVKNSVEVDYQSEYGSNAITGIAFQTAYVHRRIMTIKNRWCSYKHSIICP